MSDSIGAVWVVTVYEGEKAKNALAHADAGIGYIVLERNNNKLNPACRVAFRYVLDRPIPPHLDVVKDPFKIKDYEKTLALRQGVVRRDDKQLTQRASMEKIAEIRSGLAKKGIVKR